MDWENNLNRSLDYIENHLTDTIDYHELAKIMSCSEWEFRRIFSTFAQVSLSEYIRCRRLTRSAEDIKNGEKIIDTALKYGYQSQAAFSRAFTKFHGISPSSARSSGTVLRNFRRLQFKLILMEETGMREVTDGRVNIIGSGQVSYGISINADARHIHSQNKDFWDQLGNEVIGTTILPQYGSFISEENCHLFGDVSGKKLLEICCGTGHSLKYHGERGASELWGVDISGEQIKKSSQLLASCGLPANLICGPMEEECGIPHNYFDFVYSVYGIGWTTDLAGTFRRIASYLKKDGIFIFSWSHPIHKCVAYEYDSLIFKKSYFDESWYSVPLGGGSFSLADRKLSTYINALAKAGFMIEELVEDSDEQMIRAAENRAFAQKAKLLPVTFVVKARKV